MDRAVSHRDLAVYIRALIYLSQRCLCVSQRCTSVAKLCSDPRVRVCRTRLNLLGSTPTHASAVPQWPHFVCDRRLRDSGACALPRRLRRQFPPHLIRYTTNAQTSSTKCRAFCPAYSGSCHAVAVDRLQGSAYLVQR